MAYVDRLVFAVSPSALVLKLQDAGICAIVEDRIAPSAGTVLYSYIGDAYQDGLFYCFLTVDDTIVDVPALDVRLAGNLDPTRVPLRVRAGATLVPDPDSTTRQVFLQEELTKREVRFQRDKAEAGVVKVSRFQLRRAALRDSPAMLATLDQSVVDSTDKVFKLRWEEFQDFSRAALNNTTLTAPQKNALFAAALLE